MPKKKKQWTYGDPPPKSLHELSDVLREYAQKPTKRTAPKPNKDTK